MLYSVAAVLLKQVGDGLGVALGAIPMPASLQIGAESPVVVEFAVVNDPKILVFVCDGLMPGPDVDDAQATHGQSDVAVHVKTVVVRTAMDNALIHLCQGCTLDSLTSIGMENSANATHDYTLTRWESFPAVSRPMPSREPCSTTCSGSEQKSASLPAELTTSAWSTTLSLLRTRRPAK